jgi:putative membrane protein
LEVRLMRRTLLILGVCTLAVAWFGPLPNLAKRMFSAHMAMHMAVVAVASPLIAFGVAGGRLDPVRLFPLVFAPIPASLLELVVVWAWHAPALHHAARHTTTGFIAEQGTFLFTGLLVWSSVLGGVISTRGNRGGAGIAALLLTSMHMTLLGALLALTPRPLYAHADLSMSLGALADQQLGGAIMIVVGGVSYLAGGLWLTIGLLRTAPLRAEARA